MDLIELKNIVEKKIRDLLVVFKEDPGFFLSEADVKCYLYSLLINDPHLSRVTPKFKHSDLKKSSKTILVHSELRAGIKPEDIVIIKPASTIDYSSFYTSIGIEIKFNRKRPARKEKSNIVNDIKKLRSESFGYLLWLNWDREIREDQLKRVKKLVKKCRNVKFFYIDLFSQPMRTNVKF